MPLLQPPSPLRPSSFPLDRRVLAVGGVGVGALLVLGGVGGADPRAAAALAAAVALITLGQSIRRRLGTGASMEAPGVPGGGADAVAGLPFAAMIEALPDPVLVIAAQEPDDLTGRRFVFVNTAAREQLKIQKDAGLLVTVLRDPDVLEAVDEALFGGLAGEAVYVVGATPERVLRATALPLAAGVQDHRLALLVFRDETETRRLERTRADFLANASHELRTPLASLSGFIETLRGHAREDVGARDRFLGIMQTQAERMSRLIDDLMSLSRIELNEHVAPHDAVDVTSAVMDVVDALTPLARERGVGLDPVLPPRGEAMVTGDRDQIVQVAQNLVDNALKYSPRGAAVRVELELGLSAEAAAAGGRGAPAARMSLLTPDHGTERYAVLRVTDAGAGIAREHLPRLTERFYRVEGQKSGERLGTGLGLAIVKHIVNRHRGGFAVESLVGAGTTFTAYFPQAAARPVAAADSPHVMKLS